MSKTEQLVFEIAEKLALPLGFEIAHVEYKKEGSEYFLRVFIDTDEGYISIDDCEKVSRALSDELDKSDPIKEAYYLEVCSPGIDRTLRRDKEFIRFLGSEVDVKLFAPVDGVKEFSGVLASYESPIAKIKASDKEYSVNKDDAVYIKLAVKF